MSQTICVQPAALVAEIARVIEEARPSKRDVLEVRRQVLARQAHLGLEDRAAPECVAESFFRCRVIDHLQRRFRIELEAIPDCINSSHTATRGVCSAPARHSHQHIADAEWAKAWRRLQHQHPEVNVYVRGRRSAKRADLYLVTREEVVSVEFKYVGRHGLRDVPACAAQMRRYVEKHAATLLAIYDGANNGSEVRGVDRLRSLLGPAVRIVVVSGPDIPAR
jgi:hypothetical protein